MNNYQPYPFEQPVIWHACFHPEKRWWGGVYSHVSLAGKAEDTWIHLDFHNLGVSVTTIYRYDEVQDYLTFLLASYAVVRVGVAQPTGRQFLRPMTCVGFVKHLLGLQCGAVRPDSLFRHLLRDKGGVWLNEKLETTGNAGTAPAADHR